MTDQEKVLAVMEEEKRPLKARAIAKLIFEKFDGYRLPGWAVKNILWDEDQLRDLIKYDNENYTYSLQANIDILRRAVTDDDFVFSIEIERFERMRNDNNIINYTVQGDKVTIQHCLDKEDLESMIIGLIRSEIEQQVDRRINFKKVKANISKAINDRK